MWILFEALTIAGIHLEVINRCDFQIKSILCAHFESVQFLNAVVGSISKRREKNTIDCKSKLFRCQCYGQSKLLVQNKRETAESFFHTKTAIEKNSRKMNTSSIVDQNLRTAATYSPFSFELFRTTIKNGSNLTLKCNAWRLDAASVNRIRNQPLGLPYGIPVITMTWPKAKFPDFSLQNSNWIPFHGQNAHRFWRVAERRCWKYFAHHQIGRADGVLGIWTDGQLAWQTANHISLVRTESDRSACDNCTYKTPHCWQQCKTSRRIPKCRT